MLVTLRDRGIPLPAGGILISPWVDLTHSFPSVVKDCPGDYIPPYGFMQKPSPAWPPPNADDMFAIEQGVHDHIAKSKGLDRAPSEEARRSHEAAVHGYTMHKKSQSEEQMRADLPYPGHQQELSLSEESKTGLRQSDTFRIIVDDVEVEIKDQIQMYATNKLMSHPLVSPVLQPSLGGLPPLLVLTGGGERLRDEQIYLAHKAADPTKYPPNDVYLNDYDPNREILNKYRPTFVQLQVWDDLCHVVPTLSFTRPAKHMFRSIAQFGAWALARAQSSEIDILDDDDVSFISSSSTDTNDPPTDGLAGKGASKTTPSFVGKAGDPLPPFRNHMIRQRVNTKGMIYPLDPPEALEATQQTPEQVGAVNPQLVKKWLAAKKKWDHRFAKEKIRVQNERIKELAAGLERFDGETPPPSALAGRRTFLPRVPKGPFRKNPLMTMWSFWASKHDEKTLEREVRAEEADQTTNAGITSGEGEAPAVVAATTSRPRSKSLQKREAASGSSVGRRSISRRRAVSDAGQASISEEATVEVAAMQSESAGDILTATIARANDTVFLQPPAPGAQISSYVLTGINTSDSKSIVTDENASTRAVRNAKGVLPSLVRGSSLRTEYRPASQAGSQAPTVTLTSDMGESVSVVSDSFTPSMDGDGEPDPNASTVAIIGAPGVIGQKAKRQSGLLSEASSIYRQESNTGQSTSIADSLDPDPSKRSASVRSVDSASGVIPPIGDESKSIDQVSNETRPSVPGREDFTTAPEIPAVK